MFLLIHVTVNIKTVIL